MILVLEHLAVVLGVFLVALSMILALQARRSPQSAAAWILFIIALPYVAVPLFLLLGFRKERRGKTPLRLAIPTPATAEDPAGIATLFHRLGAAPAQPGNRLDLHATPEAARDALDALVSGASTRIDALLYIVADDDSGRRFVEHLTERARAGVKVRLGVDRLGSLRRPRAALHRLVEAGGEVRLLLPILQLRKAGNLNLRNHRKLVIADGATVWAGGRNVGDDYLASPPGRWTDLSFTLTGPAVLAYAEVFASDWRVAGGQDAARPAACAPAGPSRVQLVPAGPDEAHDVLHDGLVAAIQRADRRVWLATPYFVPTEPLALALATAARGGRDVRLCLPDKSNQPTADLARGAYLREAAAAGVRIQRYLPGMMHAKAGLIDGYGWVGSANFDVRSMLLNFETALMIYDAETVAALEGWFLGLAPECAEGLRPASRSRRLVEGIFRLGAPIL